MSYLNHLPYNVAMYEKDVLVFYVLKKCLAILQFSFKEKAIEKVLSIKLSSLSKVLLVHFGYTLALKASFTYQCFGSSASMSVDPSAYERPSTHCFVGFTHEKAL